MAVKAIACELPATLGVPLSRLHVPDVRREILRQGVVAEISGATIWRWLSEDAIKPWTHRSWIFPRDPDFETKAGRVLDLYHRTWHRKPLRDDEYVISADEKTSIQARIRLHPTSPAGPGQPARIEHGYQRGGALAYLAAWDVHHARLFGRCQTTTGIAPFGRLVEEVMTTEPYASARRVYWVVDNGSSHRGQAATLRMRQAWPTARLVHLPIHSSWLNQIEIYFSILQRKVLTPNDFTDLAHVEARIHAFADLYQNTATPFEWRFTRRDLTDLLHRLAAATPTAA
ncbi:MAG TPA: IS630 family transposase [Acidimicrobiia bacterium]|nr:IS630 family transposase [Acidimicrobiia bacterium]